MPEPEAVNDPLNRTQWPLLCRIIYELGIIFSTLIISAAIIIAVELARRTWC